MSIYRGLRAHPDAPIDVDYKVSCAYLDLIQNSPAALARDKAILSDWCFAHADFHQKQAGALIGLQIPPGGVDGKVQLHRDGAHLDLTETEESKTAIRNFVTIDATLKSLVWETAGIRLPAGALVPSNEGDYEFKTMPYDEESELRDELRRSGDPALLSHLKGLSPLQARALRAAARELREPEGHGVQPRHVAHSLEELESVFKGGGWHEASATPAHANEGESPDPHVAAGQAVMDGVKDHNEDRGSSKAHTAKYELGTEETAIAILYKHRDWSISRIADEMGVHRSTLYRCEELINVHKTLEAIVKAERARKQATRNRRTGDLDVADSKDE